MTGPLKGIRILDLTTVVMGPFATQILGDMDADVVKIESPAGDLIRKVGPARHDDMGPLYLQANRNKRSVVLDLKDPAGLRALLELVRGADVLVYNIRPQAMRRLGLDYERLAAINPGLIFCGAFGFGEEGPYAGRPAYDDIMQAAAGVASLFQQTQGAPAYAPINICDRTVGLYLANALLAALFHRQRTGEGQSIELPMFETMVQFVMGDHLSGQAFVPPKGDPGYKRILTAQRRPFPTKEGHLCVVVYSDEHWRKFSAMVGIPDVVANDPHFSSLPLRTQHADHVGAFLAGHLLARTAREWIDLFDRADIPATRVNSLSDLLTDPHLEAVGFWQELEHPTEGRLKVPKPPGTWSRTPPGIQRLAPNLGEHSREILGEECRVPVQSTCAAGSACQSAGPQSTAQNDPTIP